MKKPLQFTAAMVAVLLSTNTFAQENNEPNFQLGLGIGAPYGVLGLQAAFATESVRGYVAAGMVWDGLSLGLEFAVDEEKHHAIGINYARFTVPESEGIYGTADSDLDYEQTALTYAYHISGLNNSGWTVGLTVGQLTENDPYWDEEDSFFNVGFFVGYKFGL